MNDIDLAKKILLSEKTPALIYAPEEPYRVLRAIKNRNRAINEISKIIVLIYKNTFLKVCDENLPKMKKLEDKMLPAIDSILKVADKNQLATRQARFLARVHYFSMENASLDAIKKEKIRFMNAEMLDCLDIVVKFIRNCSSVSDWERVYFEKNVKDANDD